MKRLSPAVVLFLIVFVDLVGFGLVIPMLPLFARSFDATATEVGLLMFSYSFFQMILSPLWGGLSDRMGRKPVLLFTIAGQALCYLWAGVASDFFSLLVSRAVAGVFAGNISTANAYMSDLTTKESRVRGMGMLGAAFGLGFIVGPALGGLLMQWGNSIPFYFAGVLCLANLFLGSAVLKEISTREDRSKNRRRVFLKDLIDPKMRRLLFLVSITFLLTMALTQVEVTLSLFALDRFFISPHQSLFLFAGMGIVMALVQGLFIGRLNKKYKETRLALTGVVLICLGLTSLVFSHSIVFGFLSISVMAIGYSLSNPCLMAMVSNSVPEDRVGSAFGLYQSGSSLSRILGPLIAGPLYDWRIELPFFSGVCFVIVAGALLTQDLFIKGRKI